MNVFAFSLAFFVHSLYTIGNVSSKESKNAIAATHYLPEDTFVLTDLKLAYKVDEITRLTGQAPLFNGFILMCGSRSVDEHDINLGNYLYEKKSYNRLDEIPDDKICDLQPAPTLVQESEGYTIGYNNDKAISMIQGTNVKLTPQNGRIPVFWINFDLIDLKTYETRHRFFLYRKYNIPTESCKTYAMVVRDKRTLKLKKGIDMEAYYDKNNQQKALENFIIPNPRENQSGFRNSILKKLTKLILFAKHQLVPIDDFNDKGSRDATCFIVNTVPIWELISTGPLKTIETFIRNVAHNLPMNTIDVRTISYKTLQMEHKLDNTMKEVYLDHEHNKFPVPNYLIKIITYQLPPSTGRSQESVPELRHSIAIVVPNELIPSALPCEKNICSHANWFNPTPDKEKNWFQCCSLDDKFFQLMPDHMNIPRDNKTFNLKKIPKAVDHNGDIVNTEDITQFL